MRSIQNLRNLALTDLMIGITFSNLRAFVVKPPGCAATLQIVDAVGDLNHHFIWYLTDHFA